MASQRPRLKKIHGSYTNIQPFNYRLTEYEVAFAVSVTDEILRLEPLDDKLTLLRQKYELNPIEIIKLHCQRVSFFGLFNLFDTV